MDTDAVKDNVKRSDGNTERKAGRKLTDRECELLAEGVAAFAAQTPGIQISTGFAGLNGGINWFPSTGKCSAMFKELMKYYKQDKNPVPFGLDDLKTFEVYNSNSERIQNVPEKIQYLEHYMYENLTGEELGIISHHVKRLDLIPDSTIIGARAKVYLGL